MSREPRKSRTAAETWALAREIILEDDEWSFSDDGCERCWYCREFKYDGAQHGERCLYVLARDWKEPSE